MISDFVEKKTRTKFHVTVMIIYELHMDLLLI